MALKDDIEEKIPKDILTGIILEILIDAEKPLRNSEVIEKIEEKRGLDTKVKDAIGEDTTSDSLRIQITNRLVRLSKLGIVTRKIISPKNVRYSIADEKKAHEQVDKEVFKRSLSGQRFQKVKLDTEKIAGTKFQEKQKEMDKILLDLGDKWKLRDKAKRAIYQAYLTEVFKQYDKNFCKVYLVYPVNTLAPPITESDIEDFYNNFLSKCIATEENKDETKKTGFSIVFQYVPKPLDIDRRVRKRVIEVWLEAMNLNALALKDKKISAKLDEDYLFLLNLTEKTDQKIQRIAERVRKKRSLHKKT